MRTNPYQWFADGNPPHSFIESRHRLLSIDAIFGGTDGSGATLGATLFGNSASFDFSRLIQAMIPSQVKLSASPVIDARDGGPRVLAQTLDAPLVAEEPTQHLSYSREPDPDSVEATLAQPVVPAAVVSVSAVVDLHDDAPATLANTLATPLTADESTQHPSLGRIPDLGFLQNLPAFGLILQPGFDQPDPAIRPGESAVIPVSGESAAVIGGAPVGRPDLIYELTPALAAETNVSLTLFSEHNDAGIGLASDLFVNDPSPLPDFADIQFAAVLPDPIVDPGPLV